MNISGTYLIPRISIWISIWLVLIFILSLEMGYNNLVQLSGEVSQAHRVTYTRDELVQLGDHAIKEHVVRLSGHTCANIRRLGISKKPKFRSKRAGKSVRNRDQRRKVNHSALVYVKTQNQMQIVKNRSKVNISGVLVNIRSIRNKDTLLADYLNQHQANFAVITETWLTTEDQHLEWLVSNGLSLLDYTTSSSPRTNRRGGGLALIYREGELEVQMIKEENFAHWQYAFWKITSQKEVFHILAIYHPPANTVSGQTNSTFISDFLETYADLTTTHNNIIVMGDFNIHMEEKNDPDVTSFYTDLEIMGLYQHIEFSTHTLGHTLDLVITDKEGTVKIDACSKGDFLSDHVAIHVVMSIGKNSEYGRKRIGICDNTELTLYNLLQESDLGSIVADDAEEMWNGFKHKTESAINKLTSKSERTITVRTKVPWMNSIVKNQRYVVKKREKAWKKYGAEHHWTALQSERKRYKRILNYYKKGSIMEKIKECNGNAKQLYKLIKSLTGTATSNPLPECDSKEELATDFGEFFINKIEKIRAEQEQYEVFKPNPTKASEDCVIIDEWRHTNREYIAAVIKSMPNKQCELDVIPTKLLKEDAMGTADTDFLSLCEFISELINRSFTEGKFPEDWKCALVKPLLKNKKLKKECKNYRPVSNLQFISKVAEKVVLNQLTKHCEDHDLMPDYQSAYRKNHSCETALTALVNSILWAFERGECTHLVALDLSAAFDTVHRGILSEVMEKIFRIEGKALQWLNSYLGPRGFKIRLQDCESKFMELTSGVAQGSCLGPVLYSCYASTIQTIIPSEINIYGFADDHTLERSFKPRVSEFASKNRLEQTLVEVNNWMNENRLKMNQSKTEFITFGSRVQLRKCECELLNVSGEIVKRTPCIKYLGANLDELLSFSTFVKTKCQKAIANLKRIQKLRPLLSKDVCHQLVIALVITHLDYANAILIGISKQNISRLQRVQNMAAKTVCNRMGKNG